MRSIFKSVDSELSRFPSLMWEGLIQSVEGLKRGEKKPASLERERFLLQIAFGFHLQH